MPATAPTRATVRALTSADIRPAVRLFDRTLGDGYLSGVSLADMVVDPRATAFGVFAAGGMLVGAATATDRLDADELISYGLELSRLPDGPVGTLSSAAVEPAWRRRGLGGQLVAARCDWLARRGCRAALTVSWRSGRAESAGPLTTAGFVPVAELAAPWRHVASPCPVDGLPCGCDATIMVRTLTS